MNYKELSNDDLKFELYEITTEVQKRLKCGGGSGAIACCAEAERSTQAGAEESREDSRGCAGEARHALECAAGEAMIKADFHEVQAAHAFQSGKTKLRNLHKCQEAAFRKIAYTLCNLMPKPDSEARNERSGRRNSPDQG